jgi:predicted anti-sigma-YlaC factor YlaD
MRCNVAQEYMMKYFDKNINDIEEGQLKQHIKICKKCADEFYSMKDILCEIEQDNENEVEPPENFELEIMNRIKNETEVYGKTPTEVSVIYNTVAIAFSVIFLVFLGGGLFEAISSPLKLIAFFQHTLTLSQDIMTSLITMVKGVGISVLGITKALYQTYYYIYIVLALLLVAIQRIFVYVMSYDKGGSK